LSGLTHLDVPVAVYVPLNPLSSISLFHPGTPSGFLNLLMENAWASASIALLSMKAILFNQVV
jgi:hypothetical protein